MSFLSNVKNEPFTHGDWYKFFVESTGDKYKLTTKDLEGVTIKGNFLAFPLDFHIVDVLIDVNPVPLSSNDPIDFNHSIRVVSTGHLAVPLPDKDCFDWADIFIFGYFN